MKSTVITTDSYILRPFTEEDAQLWQVWDIDPAVQAHMPESPNTPHETPDQHAYIIECENDPTGYYWSIETKENITIGTVALTDIHTHHQIAEIGVVIGDKNYWNKGVATEAVRAIIDHASKDLRITRINAEVEDGNIGMIRAFEKTGFEQDGLFRSARVKNNTRIDVLHFGIVMK